MPVCHKCHSWKSNKVYNRHRKRCQPTDNQPSMKHHKDSVSGSINTKKIQRKDKGDKE